MHDRCFIARSALCYSPFERQVRNMEELVAESAETVNICLKVLSKNKKAVKESYQLKGVRRFTSAKELKEFILEKHREKFEAATHETLEIGFYGPPRGTRFIINDDTTLTEAYSLEQKQWLALWGWTPPAVVAATSSCKRKTQSSTLSTATSTAKRFCQSSQEDDVYEGGKKEGFVDVLGRLVEKHGGKLPEFKIRVWARMLANNTWNSEDECPHHSFFTGKKTEHQKPQNKQGDIDPKEKKVERRGVIFRQLRELKELKDADVLNSTQFEAQKKILLAELEEIK